MISEVYKTEEEKKIDRNTKLKLRINFKSNYDYFLIYKNIDNQATAAF